MFKKVDKPLHGVILRASKMLIEFLDVNYWLQGSSFSKSRAEVFIGWQYPKKGWFKFNSDGSIWLNVFVACEAVCRDKEGKWITRFCKYIGILLIMMGELWGVYTPMEIAGRMGWHMVHFRLDLEVVVKMIQLRCNKVQPCRAIVGAIRVYLERD